MTSERFTYAIHKYVIAGGGGEYITEPSNSIKTVIESGVGFFRTECLELAVAESTNATK